MDTHPSITSPELVTTAQVARALSVSLPTVRKLLDDGKLSGIRDGRLIRIERSSLTRYLETTRAGGGRRG